MKKMNIILKTEWAEMFARLTDEQAGELVKAMFAYQNDDEVDISDPILLAVFAMIRSVMDENQTAYEDKCRKNAVNANKRYHPEEEEGDSMRTDATACDGMQTDANIKECNVKEDIKENTPNGVQKKSSRFSAPTVEQVQEYITEKGYQVDAERFVDFYASKGWKVGSSPMKDWRAAVRNWSRERKTEKPPNREAPKNRFNNFEPRKYTADDFAALARVGL